MPPFGLMFSPVRKIDLGVITAWSGAIGNIPPGWSLCDGTLGTPNLTDRFVPSAGLSFSVGDTGGAVNHTHDFTGDGHTHTLPAGAVIGSGAPFSNVSSSQSITGTTAAASIVPPFYALAYIQFIGN